ncbi:MAG: DNA polymerase III subunit delta [Clostridia bacterium]|nr:DNA polymerase III subunit delta [Clostridia bacterium]
MAILNEDSLRKLLKTETPHGLFCLYGEDMYLKDFYLKKLIDAAIDPAFAAFNLRTFVRNEHELTDILEATEALPMMSEYQCVLLRDYPLQDLLKDDFEVLSDTIKNLPESTLLIFFFSDPAVEYNTKKPDKLTKYFDLFQKHGVLVNFAHRTPSSIAKMLVSGAKERGTSIDAQTASYLIDRAGTDLQTLFNEFNKVCAYACGEPVTEAMINECVQQTVEASVFDISHALLTGNADRAFEILHELMRQKSEAQTIIGAMAFNWADLYRAKAALLSDHRLSDYQGYNYQTKSATAIEKTIRDARLCTLTQIKSALDILADTDAQLKSRSVNDALLLEETLVRLAGVYDKRDKN